jgi:hypothetical protein
MAGIEGIVDILNIWLARKLETVHTVIPGRIETYDAQERSARVEPLVNLRTRDGSIVELPFIDGVPVVFPSTSKADLVFPLERGDGCLLLFSEAAIGNFLNGRVKTDPESAARFSLTDAIAVPGLWSFRTAPSAPARTDSLYLRFREAELELDAASKAAIRNGSSGLKGELEALWDEIIELYDIGATWTGIATPSGDAVTPDAATILRYTTGKTRSQAAKTALGDLLRD